MSRNEIGVLSLAISLARHQLLLVSLTITQALGHLAMAILHLVDRVAPVIDPRSDLELREWIIVLGSSYWAPVHVAIAAAVAAGLLLRWHAPHRWKILVWSCAASAAVWSIWSVLMLAWSANTTPPVSMAAGILGLVAVTPMASLCSWAWAEPPAEG